MKNNPLYNCFCEHDEYIIDLLKWIWILEDLLTDIRITDMDNELAEEIQRIQKRLTNEVGERVVAIDNFPIDK